MPIHRTCKVVPLLLLLILISGDIALAQTQTTAFTYQGRLNDGGTPANGNYDLQFGLWDSVSGGTQIGSTLTLSPVGVNNGAYTVQLDFGAAAFPGANRFLEMSVRPTGAGSYVILSPRQPITSVPYAIRSLNGNGPPFSGADPVAIVRVTNTQAGITNPSPANLPPAALRAEATSTINSTAGVLGISAGTSRGLGVFGIATGTPSSGDVTGVLGIATSTTGSTKGLAGSVSSPDGIAIQADSTNGARLFVGSNESTGDVFTIDSLGRATGRSFLNTDQSFAADRFGNVRAHSINVGPPDGTADTFVVQSNGAVTAQGLFVGQNGNTLIVNNGVIGANGSVTVTGSLSVTGAKNAIAKLSDGRSVLLYSMESPENWFEDFGTVRLHQGGAWIAIDKTFAQTVNAAVGYHVFLTPNGNCRGLYIARKTSSGFEVRELGRGRSNIAFDYRIVAQRRGYEKVRFAAAPRLADTSASKTTVRQ